MGKAMHPEQFRETAGKYVEIPDKYTKPDTPGFETVIRSGKQEMDLKLTGVIDNPTKPGG